MNARLFHQRARDCLKLVDECPDVYAREALKELADEFTDMAKTLEKEASASRTKARDTVTTSRQRSAA